MPIYRSNVFVFPNGEKIEVFPVGALLKALNRRRETLYLWERNGTIPKTMFYDTHGHRLYTQEQIIIAKECMLRADVKQGSAIRNTLFSAYIFEEWNKLNEKYRKIGGYIK